MLNYFDVIKAQSGIPVDDTWAQLWGNAMSTEYVISTYIGTLPTTLRTVEGYLESYKIYGNTVQDGTPTPENPIVPSGCGERVDITGLNEPLCGIGTYTDSLELSTGILTRKIKKVALTGNETVTNTKETTTSGLYCFVYKFSDLNMSDIADYDKAMTQIAYPQFICTHFKSKAAPSTIPNDYYDISDGEMGANSVTQNLAYNRYLILCASGNNSAAAFKSYLRQQYAAGTPVTVWYVLAEPEVSTIPVPSGLTGTIDGYLIQDGTPAPETPIYPTANGVKQADGTYSIPYGYKLPLTVNGVEYPIYLDDAQLAKDEYVDSETGKIYHNVGGELTPIDPPAPFPRIPTVAGTTVIDYNGEPKPDKVELTYRKQKG